LRNADPQSEDRCFSSEERVFRSYRGVFEAFDERRRARKITETDFSERLDTLDVRQREIDSSF
jgi:hypothetical protein